MFRSRFFSTGLRVLNQAGGVKPVKSKAKAKGSSGKVLNNGPSGSTNGSTTGKVSPSEYLSQIKQQEVEQQQFKSSLLQGDYPYEPKIISNEPINVELLKYKPIRLPKTHGHEVATIKFRGYEEDDIKLAGEFVSRAAFFLGIPVSSIIKEKTEKRLYTVIKSPFAQAKTKQNFHRVTYNYKVIGYDANAEVVDLWMSYVNKYAVEGVKYSAKIHTRESQSFVKELDDLKDFAVPESYKDSNDPIMERVEELLASDQFKKHF
ncbi:37S ribosomal protein S10, mitochondrial [[Candida] jaroonii]|uniref:37S ribosomal protein S10, mitochondrial n=1 Tax=[Candida] jaroonii TaxID=467808 RepID=A0ACA9YFU7_9ASCO|nr:37S ribosomal protein S10, mitochondrial [[Candida] jaroonii]